MKRRCTAEKGGDNWPGHPHPAGIEHTLPYLGSVNMKNFYKDIPDEPTLEWYEKRGADLAILNLTWDDYYPEAWDSESLPAHSL